MTDASVTIGAVALRSPLICGSGEHLIHAEGIRAAFSAGAAAVVAKSVNESEAAKAQLARTDYALLDSSWRTLPWNFSPPADASLFCRSGLTPQPFAPWLEMIATLDREARQRDAYVIASLILADLDRCVEMARQIEQAGLRILELNIGAPHAKEAAPGAIVLERDSARVRAIVSRVRSAVKIPLWIKLTGQSDDVAGLALAAKEAGADAVTVMGRFIAFLPDVETQAPLLGTNAAYGGPWALPLTCHWLAQSRKKTGANFPLLGTNGARTGLDIARFMLAGATAVQATSAVFTGGFGVVTGMLDEFRGYLASKKVSAGNLIGKAADQIGAYAEQESHPEHWQTFVAAEGRPKS